MSAVDDLIGLSDRHDIMSAADEVELVDLQLCAARERFADHTERIGILRRRAQDTGVASIARIEDLVPILFAHSTYKSYPVDWLHRGRWDRMTRWFATVSATPMDNVDLDDVADVDDWLDRLVAAGHFAFTSSGTGGRVSFVDQSELDVDRVGRLLAIQFGWPRPAPITRERAVFFLTASKGSGRIVYGFQAQSRFHARPGEAYALSEEPIRLGDLNRLMVLEASIVAGTASPSDLQEYQMRVSQNGPELEAAFERFAEKMLRYRNEPIVFQGQWPQMNRLVELMHDQGIPDGGWHPESIFFIGGGTKGVPLPVDYRERIERFLAPGRHYRGYGMSENTTHAPMCEVGRYHTAPWQIMFVLDEAGEVAAPRDAGPVTGRGAMMDLAWDGHWGGLIGGDWITVDYGRCGCGRPGPTVEDSVMRYADVIGTVDDKISCAAAMDAYVRRALSGRTD